MRVVLSTPRYPPSSRVGAWMATHEYAAALVGRGHRVDVVTYGSAAPPYQLDGVNVHPVGTELLDGANLVATHLGGDQAVAALARRRGIPLVQFAHSDHDHERPIADLLVCNSNATAAAIDYRSIVARPYLDVERHRTTPGSMVTLVNLSAEKGGELFGYLAPSVPELSFLGVRGGYGRQLRPIARNVEVIPNTADMRGEVWSRTRILLCPSAHESWGMVGLEAMASGIPVVAHPTPGLVESLGAAGVFVDRGDLAGWCDQIRRLQRPDQWATASAAALARVEALDDDRPFVCDAMERTAKYG